MPSIRPLLLLSAAFVIGLAAGCRKAEVTSYRAPKEAPRAAAPAVAGPSSPSMPSAMASTPMPTASGADLKWTVPANWESKPASAMRKATFVIKGDGGAEAELAISALNGDGGGEQSNLVRWRGQLGLPEISPAEVAAGVTRFEAGGLKMVVADYANDKATPPRLLAAIVPVGDATWFFKLTGPAALLEREKPAFLAFLKTIKAP